MGLCLNTGSAGEDLGWTRRKGPWHGLCRTQEAHPSAFLAQSSPSFFPFLHPPPWLIPPRRAPRAAVPGTGVRACREAILRHPKALFADWSGGTPAARLLGSNPSSTTSYLPDPGLSFLILRMGIIIVPTLEGCYVYIHKVPRTVLSTIKC